jgi:polysaccharide export outer membrane protein
MRLASVRRILPSLLISTVLVLFGGCRSAPYVWVQDLRTPPGGETKRTVIGPGDVIEVRVGGDDKVTTRGRVLPDGTFVLPLVGAVAVAGQRPEEASALLNERLKRYVNVPDVTVIIQESQVSIAVLGEVKTPGMLDLWAPATVLQALAKAGGMTEFADSSRVFLLRRVGKSTQRIRFTYTALVEAEPVATGFQLKTGDVLVVE